MNATSFDAMDLEIRPITDGEVPRFRQSISMGFGGDATPGWEAAFRRIMPLERTLAAFDGDEIVGTFGDFDLRLTVPGGNQLPMAGTTMVTVRATHRRRGLLRAMMMRHLADAAERGDALAGLWSSEAPIYGRFGFGLASELYDLTLDARLVEVPEPGEGIVVEFIDGDRLGEVVAPLWSSLAASRAGFIDRSADRWHNIGEDPENRRGGASARRDAIARRGDEVCGYVGYRQREKWINSVAVGAVEIDTLVAGDLAARRALWHLVAHVDLHPMVSWWNLPIDDPVVLDASNRRHLRRTISDALYVRVLDLIAALEGRTYETDGAVTLRVVDDLGFADGTFRVEVGDGRAQVDQTDRSPDATLDARDLGALYLGRDAAWGLWEAGLIDSTADAARRLGAIFRTARAPWCPEEF